MFCADDKVIFNISSGKNSLLNDLTWINLEHCAKAMTKRHSVWVSLYKTEKVVKFLEEGSWMVPIIAGKDQKERSCL